MRSEADMAKWEEERKKADAKRQAEDRDRVLNGDRESQVRNARHILQVAALDWLNRDAKSWPSDKVQQFSEQDSDYYKKLNAKRINRDIKIAKGAIQNETVMPAGEELIKRFVDPDLIDKVLATPDIDENTSPEEVAAIMGPIMELEEIVKNRRELITE